MMHTRRRFLSTGLGLVAHQSLAAGAANTPPSSDNDGLRIALSESVVRGVSLNDARAAMAVWSAEIGHAVGLKLANQNLILPSQEILAAIREARVDLFCLTVQEYRKVMSLVDTSKILADDYGGDELALIVREDAGIAKLADLRGRSLMIWDSPGTSLAEPWLAVSTWREGQPHPQELFGRITHNVKLAQSVLPVFFGQADACVVTRRSLATMFELNPQLERKLHVLIAGPKVASAFFACRKDFANSKVSIITRLVEVRSSPAAKQVLTLFQSPGFAIHDGEYLRTANSILDAYDRYRTSKRG